MPKHLVISFIMLITFKLPAQQVISSYDSKNIPDSLKKNANAVYILNEGIVDIASDSKYTFTIHQVITLLNKDAAHHFYQGFHYDKFEKIEDVTLKVYDEDGNLIKTYQKKDFSSRNYIDNISIFTDDKILYLQAADPGYPCTIDISCKKKVSSYIKPPDWIIATPDEAIENSFFTVKVPSQFDIKYRAVNIDLKPSITNADDKKVYTWTAKNITASKPEPDSYTSHNLPKIEIVAEQFEYDGYKGELSSWKTFGSWNYQLYEDDKAFTKEETENIQSLVSACKSDREKIKVLYNHLEQNMRYVSVQLGIGGFKPFPVEYVNDKKYGDCKALTNYMRYMLKAAGIKSYPALINAGYNSEPADKNFPTDLFNHVILCVPLDKDSVWLECTSNNNEYGFLGSFTENKNALLLTENGGVLVATPKSNPANNVLSSKTVITLDADGASKIKSDIFCTGDFSSLFYYIMEQGQDRRKDIFINYLHYKIPEQFSIEPAPDSANGKQYILSLSYDQQYDFKTGSRLFLKPRINALADENVPHTATRKYDYIFDFPYNKIDTTIYILPAGATVDKLPQKKEITNAYGSYSNEYLKNDSGNVITIIADLELKKSVVPAKDYSQVADFFQDVKRTENEKFIIKTN